MEKRSLVTYGLASLISGAVAGICYMKGYMDGEKNGEILAKNCLREKYTGKKVRFTQSFPGSTLYYKSEVPSAETTGINKDTFKLEFVD